MLKIIRTSSTHVSGIPTRRGMRSNPGGHARIKILHPQKPKNSPEKGKHQVVRPCKLNGVSLYSQDTVPNAISCTQLHTYSTAPPRSILPRKIHRSRFWESQCRPSVSTHGPESVDRVKRAVNHAASVFYVKLCDQAPEGFHHHTDHTSKKKHPEYFVKPQSGRKRVHRLAAMDCFRHANLPPKIPPGRESHPIQQWAMLRYYSTKRKEKTGLSRIFHKKEENRGKPNPKGRQKAPSGICRWGLPLSFREFVIYGNKAYDQSIISHQGRETFGS